MPSERILIIDDDQRVADLLTRLLVQEKYEIATVSTGKEALSKVTAWQPSLIVLDLMLPDIDGYELLEKIKKNSQATVVPVMIVSARNERHDKLRGLRLGVMDYLTKPFDRQELVVRIRNILDFHRAHIQMQQQRTQENLPRRVIEFLRERQIQTLVPRFRRDAKVGYEYPEVAPLVQPEEIGGEIFVLEKMAKDRLLEKVFFDTILICPQCGHHDLHLRAVCPFCQNADLQRLAGTQPNSAGTRTPENSSTFLQREGKLQAQPADADAKAFCHRCNKSCDPVLVCRCTSCSQLFHVRQAQARRIHAYKLPTGVLGEREPEPQVVLQADARWPLMDLFRELQMAHMGEEAFFRQVELHIRRAKQEGCRFSLLGLHLRNLFGEALNSEKARELLGVLKPTLRSFDLIGLKSSHEWMILLPDTPFSMAKILATRLDAACERLAWEESLAMSLASYPEDGVRAEELLQILELGIVTVPRV